ncbi:MAG: acetylornithine transaminase, partial [Bifidobacterium crudilactis]|nr:acetylornithine transaminase [Bifidobacterium crudilactis]
MKSLETLGADGSHWLSEYKDVHMNVFGTPLRVLDHGLGSHVWDVDGNE